MYVCVHLSVLVHVYVNYYTQRRIGVTGPANSLSNMTGISSIFVPCDLFNILKLFLNIFSDFNS